MSVEDLQANGTAPEGDGAPAPEPPRLADRMSALRDVASALRTSPEAQETLQFVIERVRAATGADGALLALRAPVALEVAAGQDLADGPRLTAGLHSVGSVLGEIVLSRSSGRPPFTTEDEGFVELVINYLSKAASSLRPNRALEPAEQRFVTTVADELRSPLATVEGMLDVVLGEVAGPLSDEQRAYLRVAAEHNQRLGRVVGDLITLARLAPPEPRDLEVIAVLPWLAKAIARHHDGALARGVTLELDVAPEPLMVRAVAAQVAQVIDHLLANAIAFSPDGGPVTVSAQSVDEMVQVTVADSGVGFDAAAAVRIFDRFARAATAEEAAIPGAGLGLAIVREIVSAHGGRAWAESARGQGARVHVTLPRA